jgi:hypothetical protein
MRLRRHVVEPDVVRITAVPLSPAQDVAARQKRYLISMAIRTVCFVGAVFCYSAGLHPVAWVLLVGALLLPFFAVVIANAASPRLPEDVTGPGFDNDHNYKELGP